MSKASHRKTLEALARSRLGHPLLWEAMKRGREGRLRALATLEDPEAFRQESTRIKRYAVENLERLLEEFAANARRRGVRVYYAGDGAEAIRYVLEVAERVGARLVAKAKSLTSEEIEFNTPFEARGLKVVETDLGERIIQLAREKPYHLVFPAVHKSVGEVAELFSRDAGEDIPADVGDVMAAVRKSLREVFLTADIGVTGANIAIAETGTIVLETNEGNGRLTSCMPRTLIVLMGLEKIVEKVEDALNLIRAHPMNSTGQLLTNYVTMISGRCPLYGGEEGREMHVIVLDNGRRRMLQDPWFREALNCIRCGACMNVCPTYSVVGGHIFGHIYPGPIGIPWTAMVHGIEKASFTPLCISCGLCREVCPVDIDIPMLISKVKSLDVMERGQLLTNKLLEEYESLYNIARRFPRFFNWVIGRRLFRYLLHHLLGVEMSRPIPPVSGFDFIRWFRGRKAGAAGGDGRAAIFLDFFPLYVSPELAVKTVEALEAAGYEVVVPKQMSAGYPYIAYGDLGKVVERARYNIGELAPLARQRYDIISLEPTATYTLKYIYPKLMGYSDDSMTVSSKTFGLMEYLSSLVRANRLEVEAAYDGRRLGLHIPCHQRALDSASNTLYLLRRAGYEVVAVETGTCCGMAGSFGMKKGLLGYQLSNMVGARLFEEFRRAGVDLIISESSVCTIHIQQGTGMSVEHPLKTIALKPRCSYGGGGAPAASPHPPYPR
ncbi:Lactate utilization protein B [archaeon HR01]|nr:Lactate utilization protein B [archaeon HR01]